MAEYDLIIEQLRRQRQQVDETIGEQTNSSGRTEDILKKLEELRRRAEATEQR